MSSSAARAGGYSPPHWPEEKQKKEEENALSAHLHGLFAAIEVSTFTAIFQALEGGAKIYRHYTKF